MNKSELIKNIASRYPDTPVEKVHDLVDIIFNELCRGLMQGKRIELRGFGSFSIRVREPRMARNPKTDEEINLAERKTVYFRAGKELKERINH